jgi:hypothetical protein
MSSAAESAQQGRRRLGLWLRSDLVANASQGPNPWRELEAVGKVTLTGSMTWTGGAAHNSENLNLVASATIAAAYTGHWNQRLALSLPYKQREDWCRSQEPVGVKSESSPR